MYTLAPSAARAEAHALPNPFDDAVTSARRPRSPRSIYPVMLTYQSVTYWNRSYGSIALLTCTPCTRCDTAYS